MEEEIVNTAIEMLTPVIEGAMIAGSSYAKACGRNTVTAVDVKYGMRYCAQHIAGKQIGTMFPELQGVDDDSDSDDSDSDSIEEVDEDDEPFTRYAGDNEMLNAVNKAYDEWDQWEPFSPLDKMLKAAIDKIE